MPNLIGTFPYQLPGFHVHLLKIAISDPIAEESFTAYNAFKEIRYLQEQNRCFIDDSFITFLGQCDMRHPTPELLLQAAILLANLIELLRKNEPDLEQPIEHQQFCFQLEKAATLHNIGAMCALLYLHIENVINLKMSKEWWQAFYRKISSDDFIHKQSSFAKNFNKITLGLFHYYFNRLKDARTIFIATAQEDYFSILFLNKYFPECREIIFPILDVFVSSMVISCSELLSLYIEHLIARLPPAISNERQNPEFIKKLLRAMDYRFKQN